jgi:2-dehydropantoate 2-reductase
MKALPQKIAVIGPGAIGSLFAVLLARAGHTLFLLDRRCERAAQRNAHGLILQTGSQQISVPVQSGIDATEFGPADIIFICTKAYDTASTLTQSAKLLRQDSIVISLQNGLGNAEIIAAGLAGRRHSLLCASTSQGALLQQNGIVLHTGRGLTRLAPFSPANTNDANTTAEMLNNADIATEICADAQAMLWDKLIINAAINPVTAIYGITNGDVIKYPRIRKLALDAAEEAAKTARKMGIITSTSESPRDQVSTVCQVTASNRSSMLRDIESGRKTEIDAITGVIIDQARQNNISAPVNKKLFQQIKELENQNTPFCTEALA